MIESIQKITRLHLAILVLPVISTSLLFAQFQTPGYSGNVNFIEIVDKCGFDEQLALQMKAELGGNWGYGYDSLLIDLGRWNQSPYVKIDSIGASVQNRALWQLTIKSDVPTRNLLKRTIFVHARTHPGEVQAFWVTNELINLLISEDPFSQFIRDNCTFFIIPMYNPDGVELGYPRENAHGIDIESNWNTNPIEPEVAVLKGRFSELMASPEPIEVALNMHSAYVCKRYFVYHHENGTSVLFTQLEKDYINGIRYYYLYGIEPWNYFVSWTNGTPQVYPESWFWTNFAEAVMALTYEDMNCLTAGAYDTTAFAILHGVADYLGLVSTVIVDQPQHQDTQMTLEQNYPNPVNLAQANSRSTIIQYSINTPQNVRLSLYDILGRRVAVIDQGFRSTGTQRVYFDASNLATGVYLYRLETPYGVQVRKLFIID
jgi:hypothetical protein